MTLTGGDDASLTDWESAYLSGIDFTGFKVETNTGIDLRKSVLSGGSCEGFGGRLGYTCSCSRGWLGGSCELWPTCAFYDEMGGAFSTSGLSTEIGSGGARAATCSSLHLTEFAVLEMAFERPGEFFASISKKGTVKKGDGIPIARGDSSLPDFGRAAPKPAPAASGDFDALASKVQARYE